MAKPVGALPWPEVAKRPWGTVARRRRRWRGALVLVGPLLATACGETGEPAPSPEPVSLGTAWTGDWGATASDVPAPLVEAERIFVPTCGWIGFEIDLPAHATLATSGVRARGTPTQRLEVAWQSSVGGETLLTPDLGAEPGHRLTFGRPTGAPGRLLLRAVGPCEEPGDGILLRSPVLLPAESSPPAPSRTPPRGAPNVLVYLVDALRLDALGCYGAEEGATPNLDRFARRAVVFENAQAQSSWTRAAVASLFTGLRPLQHRTYDRDDVLSPAAVTLAELLGGAGYETAAVVANGNVESSFGFGQGFDFFKYLAESREGAPAVRSADLNTVALDWLERRDRRRPFLLYVHTIDPHLPYAPPEPWASRFAPGIDPELGTVASIQRLSTTRPAAIDEETVAALHRLYLGEVAANDASFGALLEALGDRGLDRDTVVVLLSDHGEEFFDHRGWTHGNTLYREVVAMPLLVSIPGGKPGRATQIVEQVDVFTTLVDLAGLGPRPEVAGRSFVPLLRGERVDWDDTAFSHLDLKGRWAAALVDPEWKLVLRHRDEGRPALFHRSVDPLETRNLSAEAPGRLQSMRERLEQFLADDDSALGPVDPADAPHEDLERDLEALGYL